jgi:hypothetical protein
MAAQFTNPLDSVKVASPCSADWNTMVGNNRQRFCGQCKLNVYNLSGMTRQEAENILMNAEGRLCARFFRRSDGTIITKDCPVGWQAVKQRMTKVWTAVASVLITAVSGIGITTFMHQTRESVTMGNVTVERPNPPKSDFEPEMGEIPVRNNEEPIAVMGDIAMPPESVEGKHEVVGKIALNRKK